MKGWAAAVTINPTLPITLSGFTSRKDQATEISDDLEINACVLCDGSNSICILSFDTLSVGTEVSDFAKREFSTLVTQTICCASHTHFAPALDRELPKLGKVNVGYYAKVLQSITALANQFKVSKLQDVYLEVGDTAAVIGMNRRRKAWGKELRYSVRMLPNRKVEVNQKILVCNVKSIAKDQLICKLWSCDCHPVCFPRQNEVSADYIGVARKQLRSAFAGLPVLMLQGFSGDIRPPSIEMSGKIKHRMRRLIQGDFFGQMKPSEWNCWAQGIAAALTGPLHHNLLHPKSISYAAQEISLSKLHMNNADFNSRRGLNIEVVKLDDCLRFIFLSCEPVADISKLFAKHKSNEKIWCIGYTHHVFGYLPTSEILAEGGYEAGGFREAFSLPGKYKSEISAIIADEISSTNQKFSE